MENFIIISLLSYGIWWALNFSAPLNFLRKILLKDVNTWYAKVYKCSVCLGFWLSVFFLVGQGYGFLSFLLAFICLTIIYTITLIHETLEKWAYFK